MSNSAGEGEHGVGNLQEKRYFGQSSGCLFYEKSGYFGFFMMAREYEPDREFVLQYMREDRTFDPYFMARELLWDPYWPLHADQTLKVNIPWPLHYQRAKSK